MVQYDVLIEGYVTGIMVVTLSFTQFGLGYVVRWTPSSFNVD